MFTKIFIKTRETRNVYIFKFAHLFKEQILNKPTIFLRNGPNV